MDDSTYVRMLEVLHSVYCACLAAASSGLYCKREREREVCRGRTRHGMRGRRYSSAMEENIFLFIPNIIGT